MIKFTIFDPLSGRVQSYHSCSHEEEVWHQPQVGQGFVMGWKDSSWISGGDEGFVRQSDDHYIRTADWLDQNRSLPEIIHQPAKE